MTASFALFSHHLFDAAFAQLANELNDRPGYFATHIPDGHLLSDPDFATVMQSGLTPPNFAIIGITGPAAELPPLIRLLSKLRMPCAIVLCCEGWTALQRAGVTDRSRVCFTFMLTPGPWEGGYDKALHFFAPPGRIREVHMPRFEPTMARTFAPYIRQVAIAAR